MTAPRKYRVDLVDLTGLRFGSLVVTGPHGRSRFACGDVKVAWDTKCDCGQSYVAIGASLRHGRVASCLECAQVRIAKQSRFRSVRLPSGKLLVELADETGIKLNTLYVRWQRGWPEKRLMKSPARRSA